MHVSVLLFAGARHRAGVPALDLELPEPATVGQLRQRVGESCPALRPMLGALRFAVDREYRDDADPVPPGAEVAAIPPVSGGAGDLPDRIEIATGPIDPAGFVESVRADHAGAVCSFLGTVRDLTGERETVRLDYEAYPAMAEAEMRRLAAEARARWPVVGLAMVHRVGRLGPGEVAVVVAVSCPHRAASFEACRYLIEALKHSVPIWKRETWTDGAEEWIHPGSATPDA